MDFNTPAARLDKLAAHYQRRIAGSGELRIPCPAHIVTGKIRRIKCPVHGGKNLSAAVGFNDGRAWAKCWSRDCASADILAALNLTPSPSIRLRLPRPTPTPTITPPLPPVSPAQGREYLEGIRGQAEGRGCCTNGRMGSVVSTGGTWRSGATQASLATAGRYADSTPRTPPWPWPSP